MSIRDIVGNSVRDRLAAGHVVSSMALRLVRDIEIAQLVKTAGFDFLYVDLEHSSFSIESTAKISLACLGIGLPAFVRIPARVPQYISRVLDGGALGIVAPGVRTAADAREVIRWAKFAPLGERGTSTGLPHLQYRSFPQSEMFPALNDATMTIVQLESAEGIRNVDDIAAVDGVDIIMIGTNDLLADLGVPGQYDHPEVRAAYDRTLQACRKCGKYVGIGGLASQPALIESLVEAGARYVSTGTDLSFLLGAATAQARAVAAMNAKLHNS